MTEQATKQVSTIEFPYSDLETAISVAKGVHLLGGECDLDQLAAQLKHESATSGGYRLKIAATKMFGAIDQERTRVKLLTLGERLIDDEQTKGAKVEAFLNVPLYKALYDKYKSSTLPPNSGLEAAIETLGVSAKTKDRARQVFQRSAKQAGFFDFGTSKLIMPANVKAPTKTPASGVETSEDATKTKRGNNRDSDYHPFVEGLLGKLPDSDTERVWSLEARKKWLEAAAKVFDLMYEDSDQGEIRITVIRDLN
jgi:hypothetical protein